MHWTIKTLALIITTAFLGSMAAQMPVGGPETFQGPLPPMGGIHGQAGIGLHMETMDVAPVKGTPFCATLSTEHTQVFADGNRIHTTNDATLCRDSEGRTRREAELDLLGAVTQKSPHKLITIVDPIAGFRYVLDTKEKIARKMPLPPGGARGPGQPGGRIKIRDEEDTFFYSGGGQQSSHVFMKKIGPDPNASEPSTESLGDQTIGGVHATGTRVTTTIAAGSMGNEQPILVTSESWYSPELKALVLTKHVDPWAGELKTQFTNVTPSEPDRSLFTVPSDYKVVDEKEGPFVIKLSSVAPVLAQ